MKYTVIAYAEGGLPRKEATITARNKDEAWVRLGECSLNITKSGCLRRNNYENNSMGNFWI